MYNFDSFQLTVKLTPEGALEAAEILIKTRDGAPHGSSFVVTSDAPSGYRFLHLSRVSFDTLQKAGFFDFDTNRNENVTGPPE